MIESFSIFSKNSFRLWTIKIVLLVSVFAFSGYNGKIDSNDHKPFQSELIEVKRLSSSQYVLEDFISQSAISFYCMVETVSFPSQFSASLHYYNETQKVKFEAVIKNCFAIHNSQVVLPNKVIATNTKSDPDSFL